MARGTALDWPSGIVMLGGGADWAVRGAADGSSALPLDVHACGVVSLESWLVGPVTRAKRIGRLVVRLGRAVVEDALDGSFERSVCGERGSNCAVLQSG